MEAKTTITEVLEDASIRIMKLGPNNDTLDLLYLYFQCPLIAGSMEDKDRPGSAQFRFSAGVGNGNRTVYAAFQHNRLMGIMHCTWVNSTVLNMHIGFITPRHDRRYLKATVDQMLDFIFEDTQAKMMMGFIPESNTAVMKLAVRCGFKQVDMVPDSFSRDGALENSLVVCRKSNG